VAQSCSEPLNLDRFWSEFSAVIPLGWEERRAMKTSKFSDAHKAFIVKEGADDIAVADISSALQ